MIKLLTAAAVALMLSGCVTVIDAGDDRDYGWTGAGAQPFDAARADCRASAGRDEGTTAFITCMADKGWTRTRD